MPSRDLTLCEPALQTAWQDVCLAYESTYPRRDLILTCTYRSSEEQHHLWQQGRGGMPGKIITNCDGYRVMSKHNLRPARAIDFAVLIGGKLTWDEDEYATVGHLAESKGLVWGGRFLTLHDDCHVELPTP